MDGDTGTQARCSEGIVFGDLARVGTEHVLLRLLRSASTGTLVLETDPAHPYALSLAIKAGAITGVSSPRATDFDEAVLSAFARRGGYRFYPERWIVGRRARPVWGYLDPVTAIARAACAGLCDRRVEQNVRAMRATTPLERSVCFDLDRLELDEAASTWLEAREGFALADILTRANTGLRDSCRLVYVLHLLEVVVPVGTTPNPPPICRPTSGEWRRDSEPPVEDDTRKRADGLYASALRHFRDESWGEAASALRSAIVLNGANEQFYTALAHVMLKQHRGCASSLRVMLKTVDRALHLDNTSAEAHYLRGVILFKQGERREAARAFRRAIRLDPDDERSARALRRTVHGERPKRPSLIKRFLTPGSR